MTKADDLEIRIFFRSKFEYKGKFVAPCSPHTKPISPLQWPLFDLSSPSLLSFPLRKLAWLQFLKLLVLTLFPFCSAVVGITLTTSFGFASARDAKPVRRFLRFVENHHRHRI